MPEPAAFDPQAWLQRRSQWGWPEVIVLAATPLPLLLFPAYLMLGSQIAIMALFALSLDLILGYAGINSFGHALFFGIGAYSVGLIAEAGWGEPLTGLMIAAVLSAAAGYATSFVVVPARGLTQIMITLGLSLMAFELANSMRWLTGGADGLNGIDIWPILGRFDFDLGGYAAYSYAAVALIAGLVVARRLVNSPFGLSLRGIRDNPARMAAIGSPHGRRLRTIYTISAAMAGVAGALLCQTTATVSLETLGFQRSADVVIVLILGGIGRLYGSIVGAVIFLVARDRLAGVNPQYWPFWIGLLLMAIVLYMPHGILGGLARVRAWGPGSQP